MVGNIETEHYKWKSGISRLEIWWAVNKAPADCLCCIYKRQFQPRTKCKVPLVSPPVPGTLSTFSQQTLPINTFNHNSTQFLDHTNSHIFLEIKLQTASLWIRWRHYDTSKRPELLTNWQRLISGENPNSHTLDHLLKSILYHKSMWMEWTYGSTHHHTAQKYLTQLVLVVNLPHNQQDPSYHSRPRYKPDKQHEVTAVVRHFEHIQYHTVRVREVLERTACGRLHSKNSQG
jgi:hypothetical protein